LTHAVTYLSLSPKSNALYMAYGAAKEDAVHMLSEPVRLQIRNAPTSLMKDLQYGEGYQYAHDTQEKLTNMECMPESLKGREYYHPTIQGSEARVSKRLQDIKEWKRKHQNK
jgi:putative ATPase